jgi:sortase B
MRRRKILLLFSIAFFLVAAACGCHILREQNAKQQEQHEFETLEDEYTLPEPTFVPAPESDDKTQAITTHDSGALTGANSDYFGWLTIPDTIISYPVMYSPVNPERYLHADFYGNYSFSGTPFLDARCDPNDGNLIIYGHNMNDDSMFSDLEKYSRQSYADAHPTVYIVMDNGVYRYDIYGSYKANVKSAVFSLTVFTASSQSEGLVTSIENARSPPTSLQAAFSFSRFLAVIITVSSLSLNAFAVAFP